jgi:membrane protein DedA with SNARE-associated domain
MASIAPDELPPEIAAGLSPEDRRIARRCLVVLGVLSTGSLIGVGSSLYLVNNFPLLLIAISPLGRHLTLVAPIVNPVAFILVGTLRRLCFFLPCFYLGNTLGDAGLVWLESRSERMGRFIRWLERLFKIAPRVMVFLFPGPGMSTLAGISGMPVHTYAPLVGAGLVLRMIGFILLAEWLREPLEVILAWIDENWLPGTIILVIGIVSYRRYQSRRKQHAEIAERYRHETKDPEDA